MDYLIGIDLGTSGIKTVLFDIKGAVKTSKMMEYPLYQPQNGWAEQDPNDWWEACVKTLKDVIGKSGVNPSDIKGIGLSGQMHGLVMLDAAGEALRNSIIWCDGRTAAECAEITERVGYDQLIAITANPALTGFTAGKILWVRKNEPELYAKCRHLLLPKDYIRYKLTGAFATEVSDASGTNLLDVTARDWSAQVLEALDIDCALLPQVYESIEITGHVTSETAALTGLSEGTPVVGGAGDNAAAAVGTGVVSAGRSFTTIGTSGVIFAHSDDVRIDPEGRVHTFCSAVPGAYTVMSCTLAAGGSLQWFRNCLCEPEIAAAKAQGVNPYALMDKQAADVPIGANRLLFLPYLMGERSPLLDSNARGVFFGLSAMHTRQNMLRAVMEGVAYSLRQCFDILSGMGIALDSMVATGGGGASPLWRQMLADVYRCPVITVTDKEGPALGAAILAGVGTGVYKDVQAACSAVIKVSDVQKPIEKNTACYAPFYDLYCEIYPQLKAQFETLASL